MLIKEVQKFCEQKRVFVDVKKMVIEHSMKVDLVRNKSKNITMIDDNQHWFRVKYQKYLEMNEELKARWEKQDSFLQDIQIIAERRSRPDKAEKDFKRRDKKQNKSQKITKNLTQLIREADFELMLYWFQFNNYLSPIHKQFGLLPSYNHKKLQPFQVGIPSLKQVQLEGKKVQITSQNPIDRIIVNENYNLHQLINQKMSESQLLVNEKIKINICTSNSEAIEQQFLQLENIRQQLTIPTRYFITPDLGLKYFEASRVELVGEDSDGILKKIASSSNLMDHVHTRYLEEEQKYLVVTTIE